jgi:hypothetical protein
MFLIKLFILVLVATITMEFNCVRRCDSTFSTRAGLNRHQNDCSFYRTLQGLKQEQRRARHALLPKVKLNARGKPVGESLHARKARIEVQAQVVGSMVAYILDSANLCCLQELWAYPIRFHQFGKQSFLSLGIDYFSFKSTSIFSCCP